MAAARGQEAVSRGSGGGERLVEGSSESPGVVTGWGVAVPGLGTEVLAWVRGR